ARQAVPRATSAINVVQRVAASLGTALLAVVLQTSIDSRLPGLHGIGQAATLAAHQVEPVTTQLAGAFATTFSVTIALTAAPHPPPPAAPPPALPRPGDHRPRRPHPPPPPGPPWCGGDAPRGQSPEPRPWLPQPAADAANRRQPPRSRS